MDRFLRVLGAMGGWSLLLVARWLWLPGSVSVPGAVVELLAVALGTSVFLVWQRRELRKREAALRQRTAHLEAIRTAALAVGSGLELSAVLQQVTDLSRTLVNARYAALGVLDEEGKELEQFITSGLDPAARARMGALPKGHGLLGAIIKDAAPVRVEQIGGHGRASGFPQHHPHMQSFLGVPILSKGRVFGNLYLTDKLPGDETQPAPEAIPFTEEDQRLVEMFSVQAAVAIENALLHRQSRQLAIAKERERFAMDLHDGIIQSIYSIGLMVDDAVHRLRSEPDAAEASLRVVIQGLNDAIVDIRSYIMNLGARRYQGMDLVQGLAELARELRAHSFLRVDLVVDDQVAAQLDDRQTHDLLHIAREAVSNVRKHAGATTVTIRLDREDSLIVLQVADDGRGLAPAGAGKGGHGLSNMERRADALHGRLLVETPATGGTRIVLQVPVSEKTGLQPTAGS